MKYATSFTRLDCDVRLVVVVVVVVALLLG